MTFVAFKQKYVGYIEKMIIWSFFLYNLHIFV